VAKEIKMADNNDVVMIAQQAVGLIFLVVCWDSFDNVHCFFYKCEAGVFGISVEKGVQQGTWTFTILVCHMVVQWSCANPQGQANGINMKAMLHQCNCLICK